MSLTACRPTAARGDERRGTFHRGRENNRRLRSESLLQDVKSRPSSVGSEAVRHLTLAHTLALFKLSQNPVVTDYGHLHWSSPRLSILFLMLFLTVEATKEPPGFYLGELYIRICHFQYKVAKNILCRNSFCY